MKSYFLDNMKKKTAWVVEVFNEWRWAKDTERLLSDLLTMSNVDQLHAVSYFSSSNMDIMTT